MPSRPQLLLPAGAKQQQIKMTMREAMLQLQWLMKATREVPPVMIRMKIRQLVTALQAAPNSRRRRSDTAPSNA
jgi:hypothetical protein